MGVDTVFNGSAQMDYAASLSGQSAQFFVVVATSGVASVSVKHRFGDRSESSFIGGRVQAFGLLVNFLGAESNSEVALLKELIHEVTSVACAVLASDDHVLLTANRPCFAGLFDLLDQIIDSSAVVFDGKGITDVASASIAKARVVRELGEV